MLTRRESSEFCQLIKISLQIQPFAITPSTVGANALIDPVNKSYERR